MEDSEEEEKVDQAPKHEEEQVEAAWNKNMLRLSFLENNDTN